MLRLAIAERDADRSRAAADASEVEAWRDEDGIVFARGYRGDGSYRMVVPAVGSFQFGPAAGDIVATPEPTASQDLVVDTYRRLVLPNALQALGTEVLHASAVLGPQGVIALCAPRGTGKSTTAYALSRRGHPIWADDAVALEVAEEAVLAFQLPFVIRLRPAALSHFEAAVGDLPGTEAPEAVRRDPLAAVFVLERSEPGAGGDPVELVRLHSHHALTALLANAYWFSLADERRSREMLGRYLDLSARVPVFRLRFKPGFESLDAILDKLEHALHAPVAP